METHEETEAEEPRCRSSLTQVSASREKILEPGDKSCPSPAMQGGLIVQRKAWEHFTNGQEAMRNTQYEKAVTCFSKAINLQPDQPQLYVSQADVYLQLCDFQSAAACVQRACILQPGSFRDRVAFVYHLQGQCLLDQGLIPDALEAFTKAAEVNPGTRAYEVRSLACLAAAGNLADCLQVVNEWMASDGPTSDLYVLRARLHKQHHQNSQCYQNVQAALLLNPGCLEAEALLLQLREAGEAARQKAVDRALSERLPEALRIISVALESCPEDGRLYLFRGILHRRMKNFPAAIEDLIRAMELSEEEMEKPHKAEAKREEEDGRLQEEVAFQLVLAYNDFAVQCFSRGLYAEATVLLNKAIEEEKGRAGLYLNRGDCFFKQTDWYYALADYQQAEELQPDDPAVRRRLGVVHNTLGSLSFQDGRFHDAASMFSEAIRYNPTASRYYENRLKAFRKVLNWEGAQKDFICTLILDPTNEELPPLLMNLFPGSSVSDVLSSPAAQTVRAQLMDKIQAFSSKSDQKKMNEMTLTNQSPASQSKPGSEADELKLCVNQQEIRISLKNLLQVKETSPSFLPDPTNVHHAGLCLLPSPPPPSSTQENRTSSPLNINGGNDATQHLGLESTTHE